MAADASYQGVIHREQGGAVLRVPSGCNIHLDTGADLYHNSVSLVDELAALTGLDSGELGVLNGIVTAGGTVTASKVVVVDANKDIGDFRNLTAVGNISLATATGATCAIGDADSGAVTISSNAVITIGNAEADSLAIGAVGMGDITVTNTGTSTFAPTRGADAYEYGLQVDSDVFFTGGDAQKSYLFAAIGDRPVGSAATGDSNDALIRASGNNYAANDSNFIFRGINASLNNRSGGTLGRMDHNLGIQNKSGGTCPTTIGLTITAENYGTCATAFGGADVVLKNEAAVATTEFGLRLRNENNSIADAVGAAILVTDTGANTGWDYLLDASGTDVTTAAIWLKDDAVVANSTANEAWTGATTAGWITVKVGTATRYVWLSSDIPTGP